MRHLDLSLFSSIFLLAGRAISLTDDSIASSSLRGAKSQRSLQSRVVRTDLIRLIPFQVQIAIRDETSAEDSEVIMNTLYNGGTLLTDTVTDWMTASFETKTAAELAMVNNYTSFDSIALQMVDDSTSKGAIDGQVLSLVQVSYEGISLWERVGTGTPPIESEVVELIQRATFLDDRSLNVALQTTMNNLLFDLGIDSIDGVQPITIVDVRAFITPPAPIGEITKPAEGPSTPGSIGDSNPNRNLEIIIIVAIVVACLAFALLVFAVIWAWRSDRKDREKQAPSMSRSRRKRESRNSRSAQPLSSDPPEMDLEPVDSNKIGKASSQKRTSKGIGYKQAPEEAEAPVEQNSSYDLPNNGSGGSYPRVIGKTDADGNDSSVADYPDDSVISEDVSSSLSAYYKSGMGYNGSKASNSSGLPPNNNFNDAASMSSMDSYGYSLDGYAPSLGPAQGGYPVGPMQAARDAPMPIGDADDGIDIKQLQDDESVADYSADPVT